MPVQTRQRQRCHGTNRRGEPCGSYAIHGGAVCIQHGGANPQVKRKAQERMEAAADAVAAALLKIVLDDSGAVDPKDRIAAGRDILDRAGYSAVKRSEHEVSVTQGGPSPEVRELVLQERARRHQLAIEDAEVVQD